MKKILYLCVLLLFAYSVFLFVNCQVFETGPGQAGYLMPPEKFFNCEQDSDCGLTYGLCFGSIRAIN